MAGHLRLVGPTAPKGPNRRGKPTFSPDEAARIRAALKTARTLFGGWACLADAMYVTENHVQCVARGRKRVHGDIAVRLARALGVSVESLYRAPTDAKRCPHCGRGPT